jgi:hypothetical protein
MGFNSGLKGLIWLVGWLVGCFGGLVGLVCLLVGYVL